MHLNAQMFALRWSCKRFPTILFGKHCLMCLGKQIVVGKRLEVDCIPLNGLMLVEASDFRLLCILFKGYGILNSHKFNTWYVYLHVKHMFITSPKSTMEPKHHHFRVQIFSSSRKTLLFITFRIHVGFLGGFVDKMPFSSILIVP